MGMLDGIIVAVRRKMNVKIIIMTAILSQNDVLIKPMALIVFVRMVTSLKGNSFHITFINFLLLAYSYFSYLDCYDDAFA